MSPKIFLADTINITKNGKEYNGQENKKKIQSYFNSSYPNSIALKSENID